MIFAEVATTLLTKVVVSYSEVAHPQMGNGLAMNTARESSFGIYILNSPRLKGGLFCGEIYLSDKRS